MISEEFLNRIVEALDIIIDRCPKGRIRKIESQTIEKIGYVLILSKPGDYVEVKMEGNILKVIPKELIDKSQMWFWTKEHQKVEEEAELELRQGKVKEVKNVRELIDELNK
jgi:hypothetical protein